MAKSKLDQLLAEVRACRSCAAHLPLGPRPVLRAKRSARILIIGQAPGTKVHESGVPWDDRSGDRLLDWLAIDRETFYDDRQIAIIPMGFCYPGRDENGGDNPPRPECAPEWHPKLLPALTGVTLTLLVGSYAQTHYLGKRRGWTMTETVERWQEYLPQYLPTPHPSWRTTGWVRKNPWFETQLVPALRTHVTAALAAD
jgi:uracil-DNA glycosylase